MSSNLHWNTAHYTGKYRNERFVFCIISSFRQYFNGICIFVLPKIRLKCWNVPIIRWRQTKPNRTRKWKQHQKVTCKHQIFNWCDEFQSHCLYKCINKLSVPDVCLFQINVSSEQIVHVCLCNWMKCVTDTLCNSSVGLLLSERHRHFAHAN